MSKDGKSKRVAAVVVGVDGSAGANAALRWAHAEARLRKAPLRSSTRGGPATLAGRTASRIRWMSMSATYTGRRRNCSRR